ncbi:Drug/metabolite transporter [Macleaya cordata]|uniref:WAT1-related protein n=1 Tax=Macleaya cordata TaxID=56857 RepID=A0A200QT10_MACCD|nr:Drug/metabolite transporter [Macleaya cordata]
MTLVQLGYAGMNIISKLALDSGMNPFVMVAYRQIFATIILAPFAYFFERKTMPKLTKPILFQLFLCSILGATLNQCLYFLGLKYSTPTIACALNNLLPAITFLMAIPFRMETVGIKRNAGQAKVLGTIICVGGAMLMSFYKGSLINIGQSSIHWRYAETMRERNSSNEENTFLGPLFVAASCIAWAGWFILQTKMSTKFASPYSSTAIMCFMASIECVLIGVIEEHNIQAWSLGSNIRLIASIYSGAIGSALAFVVMSWCISRRGPLYVSMFNPLLLVIVAVLGWALLDEKIYVGSAVGSALIVIGLYAVLWGKEKEMNQVLIFDDEKSLEDGMDHEERGDIEIPVIPNGNIHN